MRESWQDQGVSITVETSTAGDILTPSVDTGYPFIYVGSGLPPQGWTAQDIGTGPFTRSVTGGATQDSYLQSGGQAGFNGSTNNNRYFPTTPGKRYKLSIQVMSDAVTKPVVTVQMAAGYNTIATFTPDANWQTVVLSLPTISASQLYVNLQVLSVAGNAATYARFRNVVISEWQTGAISPTWHDCSCDVKNITVRYGRERYTNRYEVGNFNIVLDNDRGDYSYHNEHPFNLRPGRLIRGIAHYGAVNYPLFYGIIDSLTDDYSHDGQAITTIVAYDPTSLLSTMNTPTGNSWGTAYNYWSGIRVNDLLDVIMFPARSVDIGQFAQARISASGRTLRDEVGVTADSEGGGFYGERDGRAVYHDRQWRTLDSRINTVQAQMLAMDGPAPVVDSVPTAPNAPSICLATLQPDWTIDRVINYVTLSNVGGTVSVWQDAESQRAYGFRTYQRLDFVNSGTQSGNHPVYGTNYTPLQMNTLRASDIMDYNRTAMIRVNKISYNALLDADWRFTLSVFLNWMIRIYYANPIHSWAYAVVNHIQSVEHRISSKGWQTTFSVDLPEVFTEFVFNPTGNGWDIENWDEARWDVVP